MIVPKNLKKSGLYIWRNMTLYDFVYLLAVLVISFFISYFININNLVKIILSVIFFLLFSPLVLESKKHYCKYYILIWWILTYYLSQNKFTKDTKNCTTLLNPYHIGKSKLLFTESKLGQKNYFKIIKIQGFDIASYENNLQDAKIRSAEIFLSSLESPFSIIKIDEQTSYHKNLQGAQGNYLKNSKLFRKIFQNYEATLTNKNAEDNKIISCFLVLHGETIEAINTKINDAIKNANSAEFLLMPISLEKQIEILYRVNFFKVKSLQTREETTSWQKYLLQKNAFKMQKTFFKPTHIKVDEEVINLQTVKEFPFEMQKGWAKLLFNIPVDLVWHLNDMATDEAYRCLNKAINNQELNLQTIKNKVKQDNEKIKLEALKNISTKVAYGNYKIKQCNLILINRANTYKELKQKMLENSKSLLPSGIALNNSTYKQLNVFKKLLFNLKSYQNNDLSIPLETIAGAWPFYNSEFNDGNLCLLGTNHLKEPIIFDLFKKNLYRKNSNALILGTSGSGKTTLSKKLLLHEVANKKRVIIIDPENEYSHFVKSLEGETFNLSASSLISLNPLKIANFLKEKRDEKIKNHLAWFRNWLGILYNDAPKNLIFELSLVLKEIYHQMDFEKEETLWPSMFELIKKASSLKKTNSFFYQRLKEDFPHSLENETQETKMFLRKFNLNANITSFNLKSIMEQSDESTVIAYIQMILYYLQELINENVQQDKKLLIFMDEAHIFLNPQYKNALLFLFQWMKRIRKYNGSLVLATQNPSDFHLGGDNERLASALVNNVQYNFFLNLKDADIDAVNNLYKASGGLSKKEQKYLSNALRGEVLFGIKNNERKFITIQYNETEKEYCF